MIVRRESSTIMRRLTWALIWIDALQLPQLCSTPELVKLTFLPTLCRLKSKVSFRHRRLLPFFCRASVTINLWIYSSARQKQDAWTGPNEMRLFSLFSPISGLDYQLLLRIYTVTGPEKTAEIQPLRKAALPKHKIHGCYINFGWMAQISAYHDQFCVWFTLVRLLEYFFWAIF